MYERRGGSAVMPRAPHEAAGPGQDGRRVHGARAQLVAQLVAVVGQVADLEEEGDQVEGEEDDAGAHEADKEVQLEVGLAGVGPRKSDINEEPVQIKASNNCLGRKSSTVRVYLTTAL